MCCIFGKMMYFKENLALKMEKYFQNKFTANAHGARKNPLSLRITGFSFLAEMKGFEPLHRQSRPTGFRIRTLQPLGYISITGKIPAV